MVRTLPTHSECKRLSTYNDERSGKQRVLLTYSIDPSQYPADFSPENAPDGVEATYFGPYMSTLKADRYEMRRLQESTGAPVSSKPKKEDFEGKRHRITIGHRPPQEEGGPARLSVKGLPRKP
jgi:hypothetical protein